MGVNLAVLTDWIVSFWRIWFSPTTKTFLIEVKKAKFKLQSTYFWIALSSTLLLSISLLSDYQEMDPVSLLQLVFFAAIYWPFLFFAFSFILYFICKKIFGAASIDDDELRYTLTAIFVPFLLINLAFSLLSEFGIYLFIITSIYLIYLLVTGVRVIAKLTFWQSATTIFLGSTVGSCFACTYTLVALSATPYIP
jgi:hypothetical protein